MERPDTAIEQGVFFWFFPGFFLGGRRRGRCGIGKRLQCLREIPGRFESIEASGLDPLERAFAMLEDARRIGIPAFSHLARNAFAAVSMLQSLASAEIVRREDVESFLASVRTVPSAMQDDALRVDRGEMSWEELVRIYGHLRPGSYDITSPCYASAPREFLGPMLGGPERDREPANAEPWPASVRALIDAELAKSELGVGVDEFERFLRAQGLSHAKRPYDRDLAIVANRSRPESWARKPRVKQKDNVFSSNPVLQKCSPTPEISTNPRRVLR